LGERIVEGELALASRKFESPASENGTRNVDWMILRAMKKWFLAHTLIRRTKHGKGGPVIITSVKLARIFR